MVQNVMFTVIVNFNWTINKTKWANIFLQIKDKMNREVDIYRMQYKHKFNFRCITVLGFNINL